MSGLMRLSVNVTAYVAARPTGIPASLKNLIQKDVNDVIVPLPASDTPEQMACNYQQEHWTERGEQLKRLNFQELIHLRQN